MRCLLGLLCLIMTTAAHADDGRDPAAPGAAEAVSVTEDPHPELTQRVDAAIRAYLAGEHDRAVAELTAINALPRLTDPAVRERARVFLAEVLFVRGAREAAWDAFRAVLDANPNAQLDPYEHPPDVVAFFETVKTSGPHSQGIVPVAAPTLVPFPREGFLPFGIYQFRRGQRSRGALIAVGQVGTGIASAVLWTHLRNNSDASSDAEYAELQMLRTVQLGLGGSFYALWAAGIWLSARDWERRAETTFRVHPTPNGALASFRF